MFLIFSTTESTYSAWYGNHPVAFSNPWATNLPTVNWGWPNTGTSCNGDNNPVWDTTSAVALNNASNTLTPHWWSPLNIAASWNMNCLYWDGQWPAAWFNLSWWTPYNDTWTNANVTSTITCSDTWWSWCDASSYQYRKESTNFTCDAGWTWNNWSSYAHNVVSGNTLVEYICYRAKDISWNGYSYSTVATIKIDKTSPNLSSLNYLDWWTNQTSQAITLSPIDADSWVSNYTLQVSTSTNGPWFTVFWVWWNVAWCTGMTSWTTCNVTLSNNTAYKYRLVVNDVAWNQYIATNTNIIKIDQNNSSWWIDYFNWWTNDTTQTISINTIPTDNDSWVSNYTLLVSTATDTPNFFAFSAYLPVASCTNMKPSTSCNLTLINGRAYKYILLITDNAGNTTYINNTNIIKVDTVFPVANDVSSSLSWSLYHTAIDNKSVSINVSNASWSPINIIDWSFEDYITPSWFIPYSSTSSPLTKPLNISIVDNDRTANNYRDYTYNITRVCDEAENCTNNIKTFTYHVYAWNINTNLLDPYHSSVSWTWQFDDEVADWQVSTLWIKLLDVFNNEIVPVKQSDGSTIVRNVNITANYTNDLHTDQLNDAWAWVEISWIDDTLYTDWIIWASTNKSMTIANTWNNDWIYDLKFKVYAPTHNATDTRGRQYAKWNFTLNSIIWSVSDNPTFTPTLLSNLPFNFKPIYYTDIEWDIVDRWFVEWTVQTWTIDIIQNLPSNVPTSPGLYFMKTWTWIANFNGTWTLDATSYLLSDWIIDIAKNFISVLTIPDTYLFKTIFRLIDSGGFRDDIKSVQLKWYMRYTLSSKQITYNIWTLNDTNNQNFETLKVYGITNINKSKQKDLTQDQDKKDVKNLAWQITKSTLRADIVKNALTTIKFVTPINGATQINDLTGSWWTSANDWKRLWNIIYYWNLAWANVELNDTSGNKFEWKKTIIVKWWNLFIKSNIINNSSNDILWIIVLPDENNNWWKVYIDTNVKEVDAVIFAYKSVVSYNESYNNWNSDIVKSHEVDGNIDNSVMQNQLYIFGTVFSENTIWWSRKATPVCPFWTKAESISCTLEEAQKYDFNYLRAWKNNKYKSTYPDYPIIIKYNSTLQSAPPPLFSK